MLMPILPQPAIGGGYSVELTYSSDTADVDGFLAAGSPVGAVTVLITIESGVELYASTTSDYGLDLDGFAAGSVVDIVCEGEIQGKGGASNSAVGGPALRLGCETNISGTGAIRGGGGAGGAGGSARSTQTGESCTVYGTTAGGAGGKGQDRAGGPNSGSAGANNGKSVGGTGGTGGAWASTGNTGGTGSATYKECSGWFQNGGSAGGAGGLAIKTQSNTYTNNVSTTNGSVSA